MHSQRYFIPDEETLARPELEALQRQKLHRLFRQVLASNSFYQRKFAGLDFDPLRDPIHKLPLTTRKELEQDQLDHPPFGTNLTDPLNRYYRFHQTSGSSGRPLRWLDTGESWSWFKRCWGIVYTAAQITPADRFFFPFSFGPFIGFWAAFESASAMGNLCLPAGGLTTTSRLRMILDNRVTVIGCTPTYAIRMAEVAAMEGVDLRNSAVRALIVAGEPGGNIPATRRRIETCWNARVYDHTGMTEIGPASFECHENPGGVHLIESEFIAEVLDPQTLEPVPEGECGELVITNLGRIASPVIRYRTGDQVRVTRQRCACGRCFARMEDGIIGRIDDMLIVRGNNVFPSAIEAIIRRFPEVAEFRIDAGSDAALAQIQLDLELTASVSSNGDLPQRVAQAMQDAFNFRADVRLVPPGTLPRFELKARRLRRRQVNPALAYE